MKDRTLYLHAGGAKTGSSAIQVFLSLNAERLRQVGFYYRDVESAVTTEYQITSGNGVKLFEELTSTPYSVTAKRIRVCEMLQQYFDDACTAICSSEQFSRMSADNWSELVRSATDIGVKVIVCYYVRNLAPFLSSSYDQGLKRHGRSVDWNDFLLQVEVWEHYQALHVLRRIFGKDDLRVLSFDKQRERLIESFLELLGIGTHFDLSSLAQANLRVVNRSLTNAERDILRRLNSATADQYSQKLSDFLLQANPRAASEPLTCDEAATARLSAKFGQQVEWINSTFFGGEAVVGIRGSNDPIVGNAACEDSLDTYKRAFTFLAKVVQASHTTAINEISGKLLTIDWENAGNPAIPDDFDPLGYLLCNRDLLVSDVKPFRHYLQFGRREKRFWKIEDVAAKLHGRK